MVREFSQVTAHSPVNKNSKTKWQKGVVNTLRNCQNSGEQKQKERNLEISSSVNKHIKM